MKKLLCTILTTAMLTSMTVTAFADDTRVYDHQDYHVEISDNSVTREIVEETILQANSNTSMYNTVDGYYDSYYERSRHTCSPTGPYRTIEGGWNTVNSNGRPWYKFRMIRCAVSSCSFEAVGTIMLN